MKRSTKRLAAVGAAILLTSLGAASATLAQGGPTETEGRIPLAATANNPAPMETSFVPLTPCRLFDTRNAGGPLGNQQTRDFKVKSALGGQGGAANCGVPEGATAISVNLTAIAQGGSAGFVRGWAFGQPPAQATLLNFSPALNASNAVEIPICKGPSCTKHITLKSFGSAHLLGDVLGYFVPQIHAELAPNGTISKGSSRVLSVQHPSTGKYIVTADRSLTNCSVVASLGTPASGSVAAFVNNGKVEASTYDEDGTLINVFWDFVVAC